MRKSWWKSLTVVGAVLIGGARVAAPYVPEDKADAAVRIADSIGLVLGAFGIRRAVAVNGRGQ